MSTTDTTAALVPSPRRDMGPEEAVDTVIDEACRALHLPTIRSRVQDMAADAMWQRSSYKDFLADLLEAECAERKERRKQRLVRDTNFPRPKRLEDFDFTENPNVTPELVGTLSDPAWGKAGQPLSSARPSSPGAGCRPRHRPFSSNRRGRREVRGLSRVGSATLHAPVGDALAEVHRGFKTTVNTPYPRQRNHPIEVGPNHLAPGA
ncbi:ATP-binding protein [Streptomyces mirabilis]|uniref:ATP-binding protein n=1 Tax=Streptomyces mirabilis TaxID=68239 RepID=UPI0022545E19|nr:ATP-binding protein [Streptomyces mirabilis]MCX4429727.1 ATP-binding protein [Streptomyces mirabilis]